MQFCSSAVQIVGRLFGILTMVSGGAAGALTGTTPFASTLSLALVSVFALALAAAAELADCALTREPTSVITKAIVTFALCVAIPIEAPSLQSELELHRKKRNFVHARNNIHRPATTMD